VLRDLRRCKTAGKKSRGGGIKKMMQAKNRQDSEIKRRCKKKIRERK